MSVRCVAVRPTELCPLALLQQPLPHPSQGTLGKKLLFLFFFQFTRFTRAHSVPRGTA